MSLDETMCVLCYNLHIVQGGVNMMEEEEVLEMLRHYRHDWLNDLQLISGYAQLGKLDRVQSKITEILERSEQAREFDRLNVPKTMLWLYQFNWKSASFFLDFRIWSEEQPIPIDDNKLLEHIQKVFQILPSYQKEYQQYDGMFIIKNTRHNSKVYITFDNEWNNIRTLQKELEELDFIQQIETKDQLKIMWKETYK